LSDSKYFSASSTLRRKILSSVSFPASVPNSELSSAEIFTVGILSISEDEKASLRNSMKLFYVGYSI